VPRTSSASRDQAILVDQATDASLSSDAVLLKIDWFGQWFQWCRAVQETVRLCVPKISSVALTSGLALSADRDDHH